MILLTLCLFLFVTPAFAQFSIDSPLAGSVQSGAVAPPNGWKCPRNGAITARINGGNILQFTEDLSRGDTAATCGNSGENGFALVPWNWNEVTDGQHIIEFFDAGVKFAEISFEVVTFGTPFLLGAMSTLIAEDFPDPGADVEVSWDTAIQNFRITRILPGTTGGIPPLAPSSLLGTWRFTYTLTTSTFTDEFTLDTLTSAAGPLLAIGEDTFGNFAIGGVIQDISPGSTLPFDYGVFWIGILLCTLHVFDLTSPTRAEGIVSLSLLSSTGTCGSPINGVEDTTVGIRVSGPSQTGSLLEAEASEQAKLLQGNTQTTENIADRDEAMALLREAFHTISAEVLP